MSAQCLKSFSAVDSVRSARGRSRCSCSNMRSRAAQPLPCRLDKPTRARAARSPPPPADRSQEGSPSTSPLDQIQSNMQLFTQKYDVLSALMGSMVVTSYFVAKGQDPLYALGLTCTATIVALVANEALFES